MLGNEQQKTLFTLMDTLKLILSESFEKEPLDHMKNKLNLALALLERDFPVSIQVNHNKVTLVNCANFHRT